MKKNLLLIFGIMLFAYQAFPQSWRRVGGWGNEMTDIHWVNDDVAYIAGDEIILKSIDGGLTWMEQQSPVKNRMLSLDFFDHNHGLMVGENGLVFKTDDGGEHWEVIDLGVAQRLRSVQYIDESMVYISGDQGAFFGSDDGGQNWSQRNIGFMSDLNAMHFYNSDSGYMATSAATILKTVDAGASWSEIVTPFSHPLNDVYFVNDTAGYAVGDKGTILKSTDAGLSWTFIQSGTEYDYHRVHFQRSNPDIGLVAGEGGVVLYTNNGGLTFSLRTSRTSEDILGLSYKLATNSVYAVANSGVLISSANSGASWSLRMSGRNNDFTATQFVSETRGYVIGQEALVLLTTNGGNSFSDRSRPLSVPFNDLDFVTAAFGYVAGDNGTILNTTNSGGSWTALNPNTEKNLYGVHFFDANVGYIVGEDGYIAKTENRGVNWEVIEEGSLPIHFKDIDFFEDGVGLIVGDQGNIYRSSGDDVWEKVALPGVEDLLELEVLDAATALVVGKSGAVYKTADQGSTWVKVAIPFTHNLHSVDFLDESVGFIAGENGLILQTMDQGETWKQNITSTYQDFRGVSFGDLNTGYAAGDNGIFYQYSCLVPLEPSAIFGEDNICLSQQIYTIQDEVGAGVTYEWRVDGGNILEGQGTNRVVVQWETAGRNAVMVRGQNVCGNGPTTALEVLVSDNPVRVPEIVGDGVACTEKANLFEVDSIPGTEYIWEVSGGVIQKGQGTAHIAVDWMELGDQSIKVYPRNACGEGEVYEKVILVHRAPSQPEAISGLIRVGLEEEVYEVPLVEGINYWWETEGGTVVAGQGTNRVTVSWEDEGDFVLKVTPMNVCDEGESQTLEVNVDLITEIEDEEENSGINIYPNPSSGDIHIRVWGVPEIQEVDVVNALGESIRKFTPDHDIFTFDIQNLPKGLAIIIVKTRAGKTVEKVWIK